MDHVGPAPKVSLKQQRDAFRDGRLVGFRCSSGHARVSPMVRCPDCGASDIETTEFQPTGAVVAYTIQHIASEAFMNEVPFAFVIVQLDDGPRVSGWVPYVARASDLPIGQRVRFTSSYKPGLMFEKV